MGLRLRFTVKIFAGDGAAVRDKRACDYVEVGISKGRRAWEYSY